MSHLYNMDIEKNILASLMDLDNAYQAIEGQVTVDMFYAERHQEIFKIIEQLAKSGQPYDAIMVVDQIQAKNLDLETGGEQYIAEINSILISASSLKAYANRLVDLAQRRQMAACFDNAKSMVANFDVEPSEAWNTTAESINRAMQVSADEEAQSVGVMLHDFVERLGVIAETGEAGIRTGLIELDNKITVLDGYLVVIAARPSMGKTTLGQNIIEHVAKNYDGVAVMFSLEMSKLGIVNRLVSSNANVTTTKIFSGKGIKAEEWERIIVTTPTIEDLPLYIDDRCGLTIGQIRSSLNRLRQKHGKISSIMIDYLQLINSKTNYNTENDKFTAISRSLKEIAKEFDCPVWALSQLNRGLENRADKRPIMSDIRSSGAIEQDADVILSIYRDEVYNDKSEHKGTAEIIVSKQRNGPIGTVRLRFEGEYSRFSSLTNHTVFGGEQWTQ